MKYIIEYNKFKIKYYTTSNPITLNEFIETEVNDRENYEIDEVNNWIKKYKISTNDYLIWVSTKPHIAARYEMPASDWDNCEEIYNNNPEDYYINTIKSDDGILISESDDGDDGFLFILKSNLFESRLINRKEEHKNIYTSDLIRMDLIEYFLNNLEKDINYNTSDPNYIKLIDDWDGYDDQVYIQNNIQNNEIIFWEGWVNSCWEALYLKYEYKGLSKTEAIEKFIKERFTKITEEFNLSIIKYDYFKFRGKYIMKITLKR